MADMPLIIHRLIMHKVDHHNDAAPRFRDQVELLDEDVEGFFIRQINLSRDHKHARSGRFGDIPTGQVSVCEVCDNLSGDITNVSKFISLSKKLADHLFACVKSNKRILISDLAIVLFSERDGQGCWVAILKMDEQSGLVREERVVDGQTRSRLKLAPGVLTNNDVQKAAFIPPKSLRTDHRQVIILDQRNARYGAVRVASTFFVTEFLHAVVGTDARGMTETFSIESRNWLLDNRGEITEEEAMAFSARVKAALSESEIDVDAIAGATLNEPDVQDQYVTYIRGKLQELGRDGLVFQPDPTYVPKQRYVWFSGDNGLRIRVKEEEYGPGKTFFYRQDSATGRVDIEIKTSTLDREGH